MGVDPLRPPEDPAEEHARQTLPPLLRERYRLVDLEVLDPLLLVAPLSSPPVE